MAVAVTTWFFMAEKTALSPRQSESSLSELPLDTELDSLDSWPVPGTNQRREYHASIRKAQRAVMGGNQININCTLESAPKNLPSFENAKVDVLPG